MQKMFLTSQDHHQFIQQCVDQSPVHAIISSFGIYAGITYDGRDTTEWGAQYALETRDIITVLGELGNVKFLIGVANYKSCAGKKQCLDCEKEYVKSLIRLAFHAEKFENIEWRVTTELHLKCALFFYDQDCSADKAKGVAGGRNFTNSNWADVTFELNHDQIAELYKYTIDLWEEAFPITDENITKIFESQGISERGVNSVLNS